MDLSAPKGESKFETLHLKIFSLQQKITHLATIEKI